MADRATHLSILFSITRIIRGTRLGRFTYFYAGCCGIFWAIIVSGKIWQCASNPSWHHYNPPACLVKPQLLIFEFTCEGTLRGSDMNADLMNILDSGLRDCGDPDCIAPAHALEGQITAASTAYDTLHLCLQRRPRIRSHLPYCRPCPEHHNPHGRRYRFRGTFFVFFLADSMLTSRLPGCGVDHHVQSACCRDVRVSFFVAR